MAAPAVGVRVDQIINANTSPDYLKLVETYSANPVIARAGRTVATTLDTHIQRVMDNSKKQGLKVGDPNTTTISFSITSDEGAIVKCSFAVNADEFKRVIVKDLTNAISDLALEKREQFKQIWLVASDIITNERLRVPVFISVVENLQNLNWRDSEVLKSLVYRSVLKI